MVTERQLFLVEHLNLPEASGVPDAEWEYFQLDFLNDDSAFRIDNKSRQIAFSFLVAAEAVAEAMLDRRDSIFISINIEEAQEKIRYAKTIYENLEIKGLPRIVRDTQLGLEFENGARINSLPARPPRGRARANVYLDEFAHVMFDRLIYTAALPIISKGGRLRLGSSPFGASGVFWEIYSQDLREYPGYVRKETPWWEVFAFCTNVPKALREAPHMETEERVKTFGKIRLQQIFDNLPIEDFQQEYECAFVDEMTAWITWDEIRSIQKNEHLFARSRDRGDSNQRATIALQQVVAWARAGQIERRFVLGVDVGRHRDATQIFIVGIAPNGFRNLRGVMTLEQASFDTQYEAISSVMRSLQVERGYIDKTGIGAGLSERLHRVYPDQLFGVAFTDKSKLALAMRTRVLVQKSLVHIPVWKDLAYQIHSVKRIISPSKRVVFDTERTEKHHADMFWAWAMALMSSDLALEAQEVEDSAHSVSMLIA